MTDMNSSQNKDQTLSEDVKIEDNEIEVPF